MIYLRAILLVFLPIVAAGALGHWLRRVSRRNCETGGSEIVRAARERGMM